MGELMKSLGLDRLSMNDRVRLAEELFLSADLEAGAEAPPLTPAQMADLDRRIAEDDAAPDEGITLEELEAQLRRKR